MTTLPELLAIRKRIKAKKPHFTRQDTHKKNETKRCGWRRPRGLHSKMREKRRGYKRGISIGWKSPAAVRGRTPSGLIPILLHTPQQLHSMNPATHAGIIASGVGNKKRKAILEAAHGSITILNHPDPGAAILAIQQAMTKRKQQRAQQRDRKAQASKTPAKKLETKIEETPKTKEEEKKEQDKLLTQREV